MIRFLWRSLAVSPWRGSPPYRWAGASLTITQAYRYSCTRPGHRLDSMARAQCGRPLYGSGTDTAPNPRNVACCSTVRPWIPVMLSRS